MESNTIKQIYKDEVLSKVRKDSILQDLIKEIEPAILNTFKQIAWESWKEACLHNSVFWDERHEWIKFEQWYSKGIK